MVGEAGLEPTTPGLEGRCSIQLSYSPDSAIVSSSVLESKLHQVSIHDHGQREAERLAPRLPGSLRRRSASFDKPAHSVPRYTIDFSPPQNEVYASRSGRYRAKCLGYRADPPFLTVEAGLESAIPGQQINVRAGAETLCLRAPRPFHKGRTGVSLSQVSHFTVHSGDASAVQQAATQLSAQASAWPPLFRRSCFPQAQINKLTLARVLACGSPGNDDHRVVGRQLNGPVGFHQGVVTESRNSSSTFSAQ